MDRLELQGVKSENVGLCLLREPSPRGLAFINKQVCGRDTSASCHLSLSPANTALPACCLCQVGWHGPTDPSKPLECMAGSVSCSAPNSQEVQGDVLGNGGEVAVVVACTLSNCEF